MSFRWFFPTVFAASICAGYSQQDGPAVNVDAILRDLDQIELQQKQAVLSARQAAVNQIKAAAGNGATAADLFENAVEATQFEGTKNKGGAFADWKSSKAAVLRTKEVQLALTMHLRYLALSLERKGSDKPELFVPPSLAFVQDLATVDPQFIKLAQSVSQPASSDRDREQQAIDKEAIKLKDELLNKSLNDSIFVKWLRLGSSLPKEDWELTPGNLSGILEKNVRPVLRAAKNAQLLATYELEMKVLAERVTASHREHDAAEFNTVAGPRIRLARANDMVELGQKNRAITEIYAMVKAYPQHPDFGKWVQRLRELLEKPDGAAASAATPSDTPAK